MTDFSNQREWQRLSGLYAEKSDEELLDLYERRGDLTEMAQQALEQTLRERKVEPGVEPERDSVPAIGETPPLQEFEAWLTAFNDAFRAREAVNTLEGAGIRSRLMDRSYSAGAGAASQRVSRLDLIVNGTDADRARAVLQAKLGLFPPPEGDAAGADGPYAQLGEFSRAQALVVAQALGEHRFTYLWEDGADAAQGEATRVFLSVLPERVDAAFALIEEIAETLPPDENDR